jgi:hypothetical protein
MVENLTEALMSSDRNDKRQLVLDFGVNNKETLSFEPVRQKAATGLYLIVSNTTAVPASASIEPNSSEITRIIRAVGNSIGW